MYRIALGWDAADGILVEREGDGIYMMHDDGIGALPG